MQDWDTRIKNLKTDIQIAREKYVVPFLNAKPKTPPARKEVVQTPDPSLGAMVDKEEVVGETIYENKDPVSSLDLIDKTNNTEKNQNVGLTEEITNKIDSALETSATEVPTVETNEAIASVDEPSEVPTVDINEAIASVDEHAEVPTVDINEAIASENEPAEASTVDINEAIASANEPAEAPTVDINEAIASADDSKAEESLEGKVKKTELELLEERDENELTEEEEDRMYELRRLRAQKNMNNEVREAEQAELKKADEEIAHLKTLLKPKPKKLPKGYIA